MAVHPAQCTAHPDAADSFCCGVLVQVVPGRESGMWAWWMELGAARCRLRQARKEWDAALHPMLRTWSIMRSGNKSNAFDELHATLDMNGYFAKETPESDGTSLL